MSPFERMPEDEVQRINRLQSEMFDKLYRLFEPPLPEGVPERLERIAACGEIPSGATVLDVGSGTGILVPLIRRYEPAVIYACDLSEGMLTQLEKNYPYAETILADVRDVELHDATVDSVFINACYPNIADKPGAFSNIARMTKPGGHLIISHPLGKSFIETLKANVPFPMDDYPEREEAEPLLAPFGFGVTTFIDEPKLYVLVATKGGGVSSEQR